MEVKDCATDMAEQLIAVVNSTTGIHTHDQLLALGIAIHIVCPGASPDAIATAIQTTFTHLGIVVGVGL